MLEEMIGNYPGTVLLASHDRDFLDRTVTAILMAEGDGRFTEYAGGYSDMAAQRGTVLPAAKDESKLASKERKRPAAPRRKLTFSDKHVLETLPAKIETLEKTIASLQKELSDGSLYARDPAKFRDLSAKLTAAESERVVCEDHWLELELLKEEVEGLR